MQNSALSIIIPAYNEAERIRPTLEAYCSFFEKIYGSDFELLAVLNGCVDNTRTVIESIAKHYQQLKFIEFEDRLGKGGALWEGLQAAKGKILAFVDADNMVGPAETIKLIEALKNHDIAIANRFSPDSETLEEQSFGRRLSSNLVRLWVKLLIGLPFRDTQCGAKALHLDAWRLISPQIQERGWIFDLDFLSAALRNKLTVEEVPVRWQHISEGSKIRVIDAGKEVFFGSIRIRRRR